MTTSGRFMLSVLVLSASPAALAGNVALWRQTSPEYAASRPDATGREAWAIWPREAASDLRYSLHYEGPPDLKGRLEQVVRRAIEVWERSADLKFRRMDDDAAALIRISLKHDGKRGPTYHGGGDGWPPRRDRDGRLLASDVHVGYTGRPLDTANWREDPWVWVAVHELGHALGLWHEFQRTDRDRHLRVDPDALLLPALPLEAGDPAGTRFDFASVMMYAWTDGDRNGQFFLVTPETGEPLPTVNYYQRNGLSAGDLATIQLMYGKPRGRADPPIMHEPPKRTEGPLSRLRADGWRIIGHPGAAIYGIGDAVVFEMERGLWDHWTAGGSPPRIARTVTSPTFVFEVDMDAPYLPEACLAGMFIVLGPHDWISFGAMGDPTSLVVQRTGQNPSTPMRVDSPRYGLRADYDGTTLRFICQCGNRRYEVGALKDLARPTEAAFGVRSWPGAEFAYRQIRFGRVTWREDRLHPP